MFRLCGESMKFVVTAVCVEICIVLGVYKLSLCVRYNRDLCVTASECCNKACLILELIPSVAMCANVWISALTALAFEMAMSLFGIHSMFGTA